MSEVEILFNNIILLMMGLLKEDNMSVNEYNRKYKYRINRYMHQTSTIYFMQYFRLIIG